MRLNNRFAVVLLLAALGLTAAAEETWNQWRGPHRDGRAEIFGSLKTWPDKPTEIWQIEVGLGHASPVTDGERVFVFSRVGGDEVAAAYGLADGAELWSQRYPVSFRPRMGGGLHGAGPKSTPIVDGGRLVTFGITGVLSSWNAETGEQQWQIDFAERSEEEPFPRWGTSFSPLIQAGQVIVHVAAGKKEGSAGVLLALDATTGDEVWSYRGDGPSYASPVFGELGGREQLVTLSADGLLALGLDGKKLWSYPFAMTYMRQNIATPILQRDQVVIAGEKRPLTSLRPRLGDTWTVETVWSRGDLPADMSTAVLDQERICGLTYLKKGQAFCVGAGGETVWLSAPRFGNHASIVATPDVLLFLLADATLVVLKGSDTTYHELARYTMAASETWAHPAVITAGLVVKSHDRLARFDFDESAP